LKGKPGLVITKNTRPDSSTAVVASSVRRREEWNSGGDDDPGAFDESDAGLEEVYEDSEEIAEEETNDGSLWHERLDVSSL
jgi:hypothetical protein